VRILVTGKGGPRGSWQIRGIQLGEAVGAEVFPAAEMAEIRPADLVVVVKRIPPRMLDCLRASGRRWVLDLVDGWPQPAGNGWSREQAISWLRTRLETLAPTAVVFPTSQMWKDSGWPGPAIVLPHHAWPKYRQRAVAGSVQRVGYEGAEGYLGAWHAVVTGECRRRGWEFVVNGDLATCDIGLALRDVSGYPARAWKANTKLANLQALGIPAICSPETSYREFGAGAESFVETQAQLADAFDLWSDHGAREQVSNTMAAAAPRLEQVAEVYRKWLSRVVST
jgi:hypothetical protein